MGESARYPARGEAEHHVRHVLVLGAGFIGAHVAHSLVGEGFHVDVITRSEPRTELAPLLQGVSVALGDLSSMVAVTALLPDIDHIVYAVGSSSPVESDLDPASDLSLVVPPVVRLLELLRLRPTIGLTYISSGGAVYGNVARSLASEGSSTEPISSYGILKLTVEKYLFMYATVYGLAVRVLRVANAYGPGQPWARGQGIVARLMRCVLTGEQFPVFGAGDKVRDYVFIDDIARAVTALLAQESDATLLNVGSGVGHSVLDLVKLVESTTGHEIGIQYRESRTFDVASIVLNIERISNLIGYHPTDIHTGLTRTWNSFRQSDTADLQWIGVPHVPRTMPL